MFTSDNPKWERVYAVLSTAAVDGVVTYEALDAAIETDFRAAGRPGLDKAVKTLEREHSRTVECERGKGYRIVRADEHERLARGHQKKARRQVVRAKRKVTSADRSKLTADQSRRLDDMEVLLAHQATILHHNTREIVKVKQDQARLSEGQELLNQKVAAIQERITRLEDAPVQLDSDRNRLAAAEVVNAVILPALETSAASLRSSMGGAA